MERSRARVFQDRFYSAKVTPASLTLASLQSRLEPDTALIEFWTGPDAMAAIWLTHDSSGIAHKHLSSEEMDAFAQMLSGFPDSLKENWQGKFDKITSLLPPGIQPLAQGKYAHLLIVPDGFLSLLPFDLIKDDSGAALIEHHDLTYMPSAVLLLRGALERKRSFGLPWERELVAFGDPAVVGNGESSLLASRNGENLQSLPSSGDEIRSIAAMSAGRARL